MAQVPESQLASPATLPESASPTPQESAAGLRRLPLTESQAWVDGTLAGVSGAATIAIFFLVVDLVEGRPLWTPGALGGAILLGRPLPPDAAPALPLVLGYTVMHGLMFITAGVVACVALVGHRAALSPLSGLGLAAALFAGLELFFLALVALAAPGLLAEFGTGRVAAANLLAAGAMAVVILRPRRHEVELFGPPFVVAARMGGLFVLGLLVYLLSSAYARLHS